MFKSKAILPLFLLLLVTACNSAPVPTDNNSETDSPQLPIELHTRDNITRICPDLLGFEFNDVLDQLTQTLGIKALSCLKTEDTIYLTTTDQPDRFTIYPINLETSNFDDPAIWQLTDIENAFVPPTQIHQQDPHSFELSGTIQLADNTCQEAHYVYETTTNQIILVNQTEIPCPQ